MNSADSTGQPDPDSADTAEAFVDGLRRLKRWAGVGFRRLEKRAADAGHVLPRSTVTAALARPVLPREELVAALVRACGCGEGVVQRWMVARRRIAAGAFRLPPSIAEQPVRASARVRRDGPCRRSCRQWRGISPAEPSS